MRSLIVAVFFLIAISLGAFGQVCLKYGMKQFGELGAPGLGMVTNVIRAVFTPYVLLGLCLYAVSSGFWLVVISPGGWKLSYAYPMIAISYVLVVLLSRGFFGDKVVPLQWVGILLMCAGLALASYYGAPKG
ncbi:MAG: hypothetical protein JSV79_12070 [Armatimonadota bacterium]|nr:MAG: hypothetical protein JSV79_12070 [Armatimonadota bacterium]